MYIKEREKDNSLCFVDQSAVINYEKMVHMLVGEDCVTMDIREYSVMIKNVHVSVCKTDCVVRENQNENQFPTRVHLRWNRGNHDRESVKQIFRERDSTTRDITIPFS
ncbi:hypothetical protein CAJAP_05981 [Camponotus japonicus]